jgi:L-cysteine:1D-myo-inositol 2-amino-2-deoxy-alpha-D-glucopyranoside ligase
LSASVEDFSAGADVSMYVCGVTPYDTTHLGHARTYVVFDVLARHLMASGKDVNYVQNITDVDDSILQRAAEIGEDYKALGERYLSIYFEDIAALGLLPAKTYPRATSSIDEMQEVIVRLLKTGHAYEVDGDVFFDVASAPGFGALSRLDRNDMTRSEAEDDASTIDDPRKKDPLDFVLWKGSAPGEPTWDSPWGPGRPGWHIECSTLVIKHLGTQIDLHGGGCDLIYPHHESEIVQAETVTGQRPFARHWMHVEMARLGGRKMSKSEGNMVFVRDVLRRHDADVLRIYLLRTHYRKPLDFDDAALDDAAEVADRIRRAATAPVATAGHGDGAGVVGRFVDALDDDLDTPAAIDALADVSDEVLSSGATPTYGLRRTVRALASRLGLQLAS